MKEVSTIAHTLSVGNGKGGYSDTICYCCRQLSHGCVVGIRLHLGIDHQQPNEDYVIDNFPCA